MKARERFLTWNPLTVCSCSRMAPCGFDMVMPDSKLQTESGVPWQETEEGLTRLRETGMLAQIYRVRLMLLGRVQRTLSSLGDKEYLSEQHHL